MHPGGLPRPSAGRLIGFCVADKAHFGALVIHSHERPVRPAVIPFGCEARIVRSVHQDGDRTFWSAHEIGDVILF